MATLAAPTPESVLDSSFSMLQSGVVSLRTQQRDSAIAILEGNDVFVRLPTGFGKTLIAALLPLAFDHLLGYRTPTSIVLCISPLIALMLDQRRRFQDMGLKAEILGSEQNDSSVFGKVREGQFQIVLLSPEYLLENQAFRDALQVQSLQDNICAIVMDEAHCICTWGDGFRPAYARVGEIRSLVKPDVHILAMTATAEKRTSDVIKSKLQLKPPVCIELSSDRPEIFYGILKTTSLPNLGKCLVQGLHKNGTKYPKTLVFCRKREQCGLLFTTIRDGLKDNFTDPPGIIKNIPGKRLAEIFMAENTSQLKEKVIANFAERDTACRLVICTEAFGMGMDCPNIHQIIHYGSSRNIESYIQKTGRCARDGMQGRAILIGLKPQHTSKNMLTFTDNKFNTCHRQYIFDECLGLPHVIPVSKCRCCSFCSQSCVCGACLDLNFIL